MIKEAVSTEGVSRVHWNACCMAAQQTMAGAGTLRALADVASEGVPTGIGMQRGIAPALLCASCAFITLNVARKADLQIMSSALHF